MVLQDNQGKQQLEAQRRDDQEVGGGDVVRVIVQERFPRLRGQSAPLGHVFCDGRLCDLDADHLRRAQERIGEADLADQLASFL